MLLPPSKRYMLLGILAGLLAPAGLMLHELVASRPLDPLHIFVGLTVGGTIVSAVLGWIIGRRNEALLARNRQLAVLSAEFEQLSAIDALTGISNRRSFDERLHMELDRSNRYGPPCALVMIDLDRFKTLNDRFGHRGGDHILRLTAALLDSEKRSGDMVARYGGEEFAAIFPHVDSEAALAWAERVRLRLASELIHWDGAEVSITASFGVAATPSHARTVPELVEAADRALYESKRRGGDHALVAPSETTTLVGRPTQVAINGS
jgi:diguanylate cyclase (GGDEF)-like protein